MHIQLKQRPEGERLWLTEGKTGQRGQNWGRDSDSII